MTKFIILMLMLFMLATTVEGQEYKVKSLKLDDGDLSAVNSPRKDLIGGDCALVKLIAGDKVVQIEGNVIGDVQRRGAATWVYVTEGTRRLDFHFEKHLSLTVIFSDYGIQQAAADKTYVLTLEENKALVIVDRNDTLNAKVQYLLGVDYARGENGVEKDPARSFYWFSKSAAQGYPDGLNGLGNCYQYGRGVQKDVIKAETIYKEAIDKGSIKPYYNLGYAYYVGQDVERNYKEAAKWFRKGADAGHSSAQYYMGLCYYNGRGVSKDMKQALYYFELAAEQGHADAQYYTGYMYKEGEGTEKDEQKAALYYLRAANQGVKGAMNNLANCYKNGEGTEKNLENAFYWHEKSAQKGDTQAMVNVGLDYQKGEGVEVDEQKGFEWFQKAADKGNVRGYYYLGDCYRKGLGAEIDKAKAYQYYMKGAEKDDASSMYQIGECYYYGNGVDKNISMAMEWYEKAADKGFRAGCSDLAEIYLNGWSGIPVDMHKAVKWMKKGDELGSYRCKALLGACYLTGTGIGKNEKKGFDLSYKAAMAQEAVAQYNVAYCMLEGIGTEQNLQGAFLWAKKAADKGNEDAEYLMGVLYDHYADPRDPKKALEWYTKAAEHGHEKAKIEIARWGKSIE